MRREKSEEILIEYLSVGSQLLQRGAAIERCGAAYREDIACLLELPLVGGVGVHDVYDLVTIHAVCILLACLPAAGAGGC